MYHNLYPVQKFCMKNLNLQSSIQLSNEWSKVQYFLPEMLKSRSIK